MKMGRLSTHVLDLSSGRPASGVAVVLSRRDESRWATLKSVATNANGRTDEPLLTGDDFVRGFYRLEFHLGPYFKTAGAAVSSPPFLDVVPVDIGIADATLHYHVPLLCTPWSYSTYRGS